MYYDANDVCDWLKKIAEKDDNSRGSNAAGALLDAGAGAAGTAALLHASKKQGDKLNVLREALHKSYGKDRRWGKVKDYFVPFHFFFTNRKPSERTRNLMHQYVGAASRQKALGALSAVPGILGAGGAIRSLMRKKNDD